MGGDGDSLGGIYLTSVLLGGPLLYAATRVDSSMYFPAGLVLSPLIIRGGYEICKSISNISGHRGKESKVCDD